MRSYDGAWFTLSMTKPFDQVISTHDSRLTSHQSIRRYFTLVGLGFSTHLWVVSFHAVHHSLTVLRLSIGDICWDKHAVGNSESEMAAKWRSPWGTSSVITPRIPSCRPRTLTSESTLGNHLQSHTSQNKDCRGFSDAHSWHTARELTVNEHFIQECSILCPPGRSLASKANMWCDAEVNVRTL